MREGQEDFSPFYALHPESKLMRYLNATRYRRENPDLLKKLAEDDPEFFEAHFHLGELALGERAILSAETEFLKAEAGLQDSPQVFIYLASIYTVTEELEKSLSYYDRTLALSPEYRDALLGKGISLSSLGRHAEAIQSLNRMVELGNWLMGEANYWLAWNRHALKEEAAAQFHINESKGRLPTNSEVFGLAGTIALELGQIDTAESEYKEALKYGAGNTEALFGLGRIMTGGSAGGMRLSLRPAAEVVGSNETASRPRSPRSRPRPCPRSGGRGCWPRRKASCASPARRGPPLSTTRPLPGSTRARSTKPARPPKRPPPIRSSRNEPRPCSSE